MNLRELFLGLLAEERPLLLLLILCSGVPKEGFKKVSHIFELGKIVSSLNPDEFLEATDGESQT